MNTFSDISIMMHDGTPSSADPNKLFKGLILRQTQQPVLLRPTIGEVQCFNEQRQITRIPAYAEWQTHESLDNQTIFAAEVARDRVVFIHNGILSLCDTQFVIYKKAFFPFIGCHLIDAATVAENKLAVLYKVGRQTYVGIFRIDVLELISNFLITEANDFQSSEGYKKIVVIEENKSSNCSFAVFNENGKVIVFDYQLQFYGIVNHIDLQLQDVTSIHFAPNNVIIVIAGGEILERVNGVYYKIEEDEFAEGFLPLPNGNVLVYGEMGYIYDSSFIFLVQNFFLPPNGSSVMLWDDKYILFFTREGKICRYDLNGNLIAEEQLFEDVSCEMEEGISVDKEEFTHTGLVVGNKSAWGRLNKMM